MATQRGADLHPAATSSRSPSPATREGLVNGDAARRRALPGGHFISVALSRIAREGLDQGADASSSSRTMWRASRWAPSAIWWRHDVPQAASSVPGAAARIFGSTPNSPILSDMS